MSSRRRLANQKGTRSEAVSLTLEGEIEARVFGSLICTDRFGHAQTASFARRADRTKFLRSHPEYRGRLPDPVVGIFATRGSLLRMVGTLLAERMTSGMWTAATSRPSPWRIGTEVEGGELTRELVAVIA